MRAILVLVAVSVAAAKPSPPEKRDAALAARSDLTCGFHQLTAGSSYTISSPLYPSNYCNDCHCTYNLYPKDGVGSFSIECSAFDIEYHPSCDLDWLSVNGVKYCGTSGPLLTLDIVGHEQTSIGFHTNNMVARPGFQCTITAQAEVTSIATELACGTYTLAPGLYSIKSPNYPANYGSNVDCAYNITPGSGVSTMTLACCDFNLEAQYSCSFDWLRVNGNKYCGRQGPAFSETGAFNIDFHSDYSVVKPGYYCEVRATG